MGRYGDYKDWQNVVGTGPWILTDYVEGASKSYIKNPDYWGFDEKYPDNRLPYSDELRAPLMPEEATRISALRTGKLDIIGNVGTVSIASAGSAWICRSTCSTGAGSATSSCAAPLASRCWAVGGSSSA